MIDYPPGLLRAMFGKPVRPKIPFTLEQVSTEARRVAGKLSISGVQPKLSMRLVGGELVSVEKGGRYILKPQTQEFPELPQNEELCMRMGRRFGLDTAPHLLLELADSSAAYIVKRFDRVKRGRRVEKLACEDLHQILGGPDKYAGSHEQIARAIREHCRFPPLELQRLFEMTVFNFAIGNGDAHRKNFCLLTSSDGIVALSPAYDIVSSRLVIPEEADELALAVNGRKNRLTRDDFLAFAAHLDISPAYAEGRLSFLLGLRDEYRVTIANCALGSPLRESMQAILADRFDRLG